MLVFIDVHCDELAFVKSGVARQIERYAVLPNSHVRFKLTAEELSLDNLVSFKRDGFDCWLVLVNVDHNPLPSFPVEIYPSARLILKDSSCSSKGVPKQSRQSSGR